MQLAPGIRAPRFWDHILMMIGYLTLSDHSFVVAKIRTDHLLRLLFLAVSGRGA